MTTLPDPFARPAPVDAPARGAPQGTLQEAIRFRTALSFWYAGLVTAGRRGETYTRRRPEPEDFIARQTVVL